MPLRFGLFYCLFFFVFLLLLVGLGCARSSSSQTVTSIVVMPYAAYVSVEATQQFYAYAYHGSTNLGTVEATWMVTGGVGTIDAHGLFTATAYGVGTIEASYQSFSATALVTVSETHEAGDLVSIEVTPACATVKVGESYTFTGAGTDINGDPVTIQPVWSVSNTAIGTIDATAGIFYGGSEGTVTVTCTSGEVSGTAIVTVEGFIVEITAEADTYVDSSSPEATHGSDTSVVASYTSSSGKTCYAYFKFPLSSIPSGATIEAASIKLYVTTTDGSEFEIYLVGATWSSSTLKWNNKPANGDFITSGSFSSNQYNEISGITDIAQGWLDGTTSNYGVVIKKGEDMEGSVTFLSRDNSTNKPVLRLEYVAP